MSRLSVYLKHNVMEIDTKDFEEHVKHMLFLEYREKLYWLAGPLASDALIEDANVYIYEHYPQYREFITLKPNIT